MAQPPPYNPLTSFITYQAQQAWFPGQQLDVEFNNIKVSINATEANLALLQKDDGTFADSLVGWQNLTSDFQQQLIDQGFTPPVVTPPSTGLLTGNNTWSGTNTYAPIGTQQAIIVNAPNSQTAAAAVTISKGTNGKAALEIKSAFDNSGRLQSWFGPNDIASDTPAQYITTGGFLTKLFINISGTSTGTGPSYNISFPTNDASMLSVWADVAKGIQVRGNSGGGDGFNGGGAALSVVNGDGRYTGSFLFDGSIAFGSKTNATFTGQDAFLGYGGTGHLQFGGADSSAPVVQIVGPANVNNPTTANGGFLYGKTFHFAGGVAGINVGDVVTSLTNPSSFVVTTKVTSVDTPGGDITTDNYGNPYAAEVFQFNGGNNKTLTNQSGSTRIGIGAVPTGVVAGVTTVTDVSNPTAIPGGTIVSSIDTSNPPGSGGNAFLVLSAAIDGTIFNTAPGGHDIVQFSSKDIAATDISFVGGAGTGAGNGGKVFVKAAPAGSTGSTQNSLVTYVTVDPNPATGTPETQVAKGLKAGFYASAAPTTQTGATYAVGATDTDIIANRAGTVTLTLPTAANFVGRELWVKTIQAQTVVSDASNVAPTTSATPGTSILAGTAGKWARLKSDGTNWITMAAN